MRAAIIGAGVIGSGWACRFLLHGWDVVVFDKATDVTERTQAVLERAQASIADLYSGQMPTQGKLTFARDLASALTDADWVQESLPETLAIKQQFFQEAHSYLKPDSPLASSTSGFKPSDLAEGLNCANQLLVCHPFNPVYLLPAVEVVPGQHTDDEVQHQAMTVLQDIGMSPVAIQTEIDAHVADRLLEALWREALWLVKDGVATTAQIDDIMRNGFGLRWAQMGLFETYRIAGGPAGMHHFLEQFGPALAWPWSRLTDVPDMDEELINKIATQSDAQSGHLSITELEQQRDDNLVAILRALRDTGNGAGKVINDYLATSRSG